jgi:putative FmdB family regulatory protein
MPIYEYRCDECDACFEKLVFSGADEPVRCPECKSKKVHRQMSCISTAGSSSCKSNNSGFS